jgi:hypothetical protein
MELASLILKLLLMQHKVKPIHLHFADFENDADLDIASVAYNDNAMNIFKQLYTNLVLEILKIHN